MLRIMHGIAGAGFSLWSSKAGVMAAGTAATTVAVVLGPAADCQPQSANRQLAAHHRIGLCGWPAKGAKAANDPRVATPRKLFEWIKERGYDGVELTVQDFKAMYFGQQTSSSQVIDQNTNTINFLIKKHLNFGKTRNLMEI